MERGIPVRVLPPATFSAAAKELPLTSPRVAGEAGLPAGTLPIYALDYIFPPSLTSFPAIPYPGHLNLAGLSSGVHLTGYFSGAEMDPMLTLKSPKTEPIETGASESIPRLATGSDGFLHLPELWSTESNLDGTEMSPYLRHFSSRDPMPAVESSKKRSQPPPPSPPRRALPPVVPRSELARRRRKKITDRMRILESLMPWEQRMDMGTMLEEVHKYVRFLEAQVTALQAMPERSEIVPAMPTPAGMGIGGLERLSRQQLLQVLVNSPQVQDLLYRRGLCVFSAEQVARLGQEMERSPQQHEAALMLLGSSVAPE